jgi:SAM-dependent methyltransferase
MPSPIRSSFPQATYRLTCRGCGSLSLTPLLSLGDLCLCNMFVKTAGDEVRVPLDLLICDVARKGCGLVQLRHTTPGDLMYRQYWYQSGISSLMREHLAALAQTAERIAGVRPGDLVLDIGCNDGTTLRGYRTAGLERVGFEPNQLYRKAAKGGATVINDYFNAEAFRARFGRRKAKVITSLAMFYDLEDPARFIADVKACLSPEGLWVLELHYLPTMLDANGFDAIVHEHVTYYSLSSLRRLLKAGGFRVDDVDINDMNGGSFRIYVRPHGAKAAPPAGGRARVAAMERRERAMRLEDPATYHAFETRVLFARDQLRSFLEKARAEGKTTYVYGASTKGNALLQYYDLDTRLIAGAADKNADKWGLYTAGTMIPIMSPEQVAKKNPDYLLVLIWHLLDEVQDQWSAWLEKGGRLIAPLPEVRIIGPKPAASIT